MKDFKKIHELCQPILNSGNYDSAIMEISDIALAKIEEVSSKRALSEEQKKELVKKTDSLIKEFKRDVLNYGCVDIQEDVLNYEIDSDGEMIEVQLQIKLTTDKHEFI